MDFLWKTNNDHRITSVVLVIMLFILMISKYKKRLYYNFDGLKFERNILNSVYKLNIKRVVVDIDKINKQMFILNSVILIASGLVMFTFNIIIGFALYLIVNNICIYLLSKKIGSYYTTVFEEKYGGAKKHKSNKR